MSADRKPDEAIGDEAPGDNAMGDEGLGDGAASDAHAHLADIYDRLDALEQRIAQLEHAPATAPDASTELVAAESSGPQASGGLNTAPSEHPPTETFWALRDLKALMPDGGVVYACTHLTSAGPLEYQWERPTQFVLDMDWALFAEKLSALAHPLRLAIMRHLVDGEHTVAQLVDALHLDSTGIAYHHLAALQAAGWVTSPKRGMWSIPASRHVRLLTLITVLEEG